MPEAKIVGHVISKLSDGAELTAMVYDTSPDDYIDSVKESHKVIVKYHYGTDVNIVSQDYLPVEGEK